MRVYKINDAYMNNQHVDIKRVFSSRNEAINYMFDYYNHHYVFNVELTARHRLTMLKKATALTSARQPTSGLKQTEPAHVLKSSMLKAVSANQIPVKSRTARTFLITQNGQLQPTLLTGSMKHGQPNLLQHTTRKKAKSAHSSVIQITITKMEVASSICWLLKAAVSFLKIRNG